MSLKGLRSLENFGASGIGFLTHRERWYPGGIRSNDHALAGFKKAGGTPAVPGFVPFGKVPPSLVVTRFFRDSILVYGFLSLAKFAATSQDWHSLPFHEFD